MAPPAKSKFEPLPVKVSSFGAATTDGYLYVYGGHCGKTHTYSTVDVTGRFFRVKLAGGASITNDKVRQPCERNPGCRQPSPRSRTTSSTARRC